MFYFRVVGFLVFTTLMVECTQNQTIHDEKKSSENAESVGLAIAFAIVLAFLFCCKRRTPTMNELARMQYDPFLRAKFVMGKGF
jgi:hypothetical protein